MEKYSFIRRKICTIQFYTLFLQNKFEAIHNKDYSVVKTSRAGPKGLVLFYY